MNRGQRAVLIVTVLLAGIVLIVGPCHKMKQIHSGLTCSGYEFYRVRDNTSNFLAALGIIVIGTGLVLALSHKRDHGMKENQKASTGKETGLGSTSRSDVTKSRDSRGFLRLALVVSLAAGFTLGFIQLVPCLLYPSVVGFWWIPFAFAQGMVAVWVCYALIRYIILPAVRYVASGFRNGR